MRTASQISRTLTAHRSRIAIGLLLLIWIYFLGAFGQQAWRAKELNDELASQHAGIEQLEAENSELRDRLQTLRTPGAYEDYVRGIARRDLGMAEQGETVILMRWQGDKPAMKESIAPPDDAVPEANWQRWIDLFWSSPEASR